MDDGPRLVASTLTGPTPSPQRRSPFLRACSPPWSTGAKNCGDLPFWPGGDVQPLRPAWAAVMASTLAAVHVAASGASMGGSELQMA